jgi:hypothetical protein
MKVRVLCLHDESSSALSLIRQLQKVEEVSKLNPLNYNTVHQVQDEKYVYNFY